MRNNGTRTNYYWQHGINGKRNYVSGLDWLEKRAGRARLLEVFPVRPPQRTIKLLVYLEGKIFFHARFSDYEEAKQFVARTVFNHSNKEIHSN